MRTAEEIKDIIEDHYSKTDETLMLKLHPREIFDLAEDTGVHEVAYARLMGFHEGEIPMMWYRGAFLVRQDQELERAELIKVRKARKLEKEEVDRA